MLASDIVVRTSTNGTPLSIPLYKSGSKLIIAPIKRPPALPPCAKTLFLLPIPMSSNAFTASLKS